MNFIGNYLLSTTLILGLFYIAYRIFLSRETYFRFNRYYLLGSLMVTFLLPLLAEWISIDPSGVFRENFETLPFEILPVVNIGSGSITSNSAGLYLIYLYGGISMILLLRLGIRIFSLFALHKASIRSMVQGQLIHWVNKDISPFSLFGMVYLPATLKDNNRLQEIITHENFHVRDRHSLDLLVVELLKIVFWFNPFIYLTGKSLREVHEFIADDAVVSTGIDPLEYSLLILSQNNASKPLILINNFNYSLIKRRLIMFRKKSNRYARLKAVAVITVVLMLSGAYTIACSNSSVNEAAKADIQGPQIKPLIQEPDTAVFMQVEEMPVFPGGQKAMIDFILKNLKYPDEAKKKGLEGTVYVSFIVEMDGSVTKAKVNKGFDKQCDEEALRVVNMMPKWTPGRQRDKAVKVMMVQPFKFALKEKVK